MLRHGLTTSDTAYISLRLPSCSASGSFRIKPEFLPLRHATLRSHLRAETEKLHTSLDSAIGPFETLAGYKAYLNHQYEFRQPLEAHLERCGLPERFGSWKPKRLAGLILSDIQDLEMTSPSVPATYADRTQQGQASLLGMLYVLEGSSLGAKLLFQRALQLGLSPELGARHLAPQNDDKNRWQDFLTILEDTDISEWNEAGASAVATFRLAHDAFTGAFTKDLHEH